MKTLSSLLHGRLPLTLSLVLNAALVVGWVCYRVMAPPPVEPAPAAIPATTMAPAPSPTFAQMDSRGQDAVPAAPAPSRVSVSYAANDPRPLPLPRNNPGPGQSSFAAAPLPGGGTPQGGISVTRSGAVESKAAYLGNAPSSGRASQMSPGAVATGGNTALGGGFGVVASGGGASGGGAGSGSEPVVMPAALVQQPSAEPLNEAQQQALTKLQQNFVDAVGGPNQNPADPNYLARWQDAQAQADMQFRALYGQGAYAERQKQAALDAIRKLQPVQ